MLVLFDKISSKLLYLFDINGTLRDSNGLPYYPKGNGILKDINGKRYLVDQNKLIIPVLGNQNWNEADVLWNEADEWNSDLI